MTSVSASSPLAVAFSSYGDAGAGSQASTPTSRPVRVRKAQPSAQPAAKAAKTNSDHRKEQNRIASRNYRAKRKQKLALLDHILQADSSSNGTDGPSSTEGSPPEVSGASPQVAAPPADQLPAWPQQLGNQESLMPAMMPWITPLSVPQLSFQPNAPTPTGLAAVTAAEAAAAEAAEEVAAEAAAAAANITTPSASDIPLAYNGSSNIKSLNASMDSSGLFSDLLLRPASPTIFTSPLRTDTAPAAAPTAAPTAAPSQPLPSYSSAASTASADSASFPPSTISSGPDLFMPALSYPSESTDASTVLPPSYIPTSSAAASTCTSYSSGSASAPARPAARRSGSMMHSLLSGVRKLEPSQKRLLLRALLAEENGSNASKNGSGRVEEVGGDGENEADNDGYGANQEAADSGLVSLDLPWEMQGRRHDSSRPLGPISPLSTLTVLLRRTAFRAAVLHNCLACGLPDPATLFSDDVDPVTGISEADELQSPFALDAATACAAVSRGPAHVAACVAAARRLLHQRQARCGRTTPRDLMPVDAQILVAHHPYLDVIPFRGFRARALALLAAMEGQAAASLAAVTGVFGGSTAAGVAPPPGSLSPSAAAAAASIAAAASALAPLTALFNEDELCYDMDVADGLVCWGSANGSSTGGLSAQACRSERPGGMRACVPWDVRGWEPQVWFLKKYWFLVGGWDDEMWRNCRWWHSMRGEHLDYSVFASPGY